MISHHLVSKRRLLYATILLLLAITLLSFAHEGMRRYAIDRTVLVKDAIKDLRLVRTIAYFILDPADMPRTGREVGDGGSPLEAILHDPTGIYVSRNGDVFVSERRHFRIRRISGDSITTLAGNGRIGFSGIDASARHARLNRPEGLDGSPEGHVFVTDSFNHRIRMIAPDGTITTIAGTGKRGYSGDGGPADEAQLNAPMDVKRGPSGALYILERDNHCVRRFSPGDTITTVAGTGKPGFSGDRGPATRAQLNEPYGIALDRFENLYIADSKNNRVRKVSPDGTIVTIAGTGEAGYSGDGGPATAAQLDSPQALYVTVQGTVYINDEHNQRIRSISPSGIIETVAGTGTPGFSGDGGPAIAAELNDPEYIWVDVSGNLYITDGDNQRVRMVTADGRISTIAGGGELRLP